MRRAVDSDSNAAVSDSKQSSAASGGEVCAEPLTVTATQPQVTASRAALSAAVRCARLPAAVAATQSPLTAIQGSVVGGSAVGVRVMRQWGCGGGTALLAHCTGTVEVVLQRWRCCGGSHSGIGGAVALAVRWSQWRCGGRCGAAAAIAA